MGKSGRPCGSYPQLLIYSPGCGWMLGSIRKITQFTHSCGPAGFTPRELAIILKEFKAKNHFRKMWRSSNRTVTDTKAIDMPPSIRPFTYLSVKMGLVCKWTPTISICRNLPILITIQRRPAKLTGIPKADDEQATVLIDDHERWHPAPCWSSDAVN